MRQISHACSELEVFVDKTVRGLAHAQTERGNKRSSTTKKREISCTLLSINLHFSVRIRNSAKFRCNQSWILAFYKLPYIIKSSENGICFFRKKQMPLLEAFACFFYCYLSSENGICFFRKKQMPLLEAFAWVSWLLSVL